MTVFHAAAAAAAAAIDPLEDAQADAQYRRELTHAMVYRALTRACPSCRGSAGMSDLADVTLNINGRDYPLRLEPRRTLLDAIRDECGLTGTHMGCEHGVCGACTVLVDGEPIRACLMFAVQAQGVAIRTIEGLAMSDALHPLQRAFIAHHGVQCGFCTPGFLMLATGIFEREPDISRRGLAGGAVVQSLPLYRLLEHRLGGSGGTRRIARGKRHERHAKSARRRGSRPLGIAAGGPAAGHRPRTVRRRHLVSASASYAGGALALRACRAAGGEHSGGAVRAGRRRGVDRADIADLPPIDFRDPTNEVLRPYRQPLLAHDRLRYVGEPVAAVFATDAYLAEDAADLVAIEAEELAPILDAAAAPGEFRCRACRPRPWCCRESYGDVDAAFASAHAVVALDLDIGRHSGVPLETRGALAHYDASRDVLELYGAAKVPHRNRDSLARMFGRSTTAVVLKEGNTGGGFGIRGELYPEDFLVCLAAMRLEPAGQMDRGPAREPDGGEPFAPAASSCPRRGGCRGACAGAGGRVLSRPGRLCPHPRRARAGNDHQHAAGALPHPGLSQHAAISA